MTAMLVVVSGGVEQVVELGERVLVGRVPGNDVQLPDGSVSQRHCVVELRPDGAYQVRDLGSSNGTWVNGTRNDGNFERLRHGDIIQLGKTIMRFEHEPSGERSARPDLEALRAEFGRRLAELRTHRPVVLPAWREPDPDGDVHADREALKDHLEVTRDLLAASDEQALLERALGGTIRLCRARGGSLMLYDREGALHVAVSRGATDELASDAADSMPARRTPVVRRSPHRAQPCLVTIPMCANDEDLGVICLGASRETDLKTVLLAETIVNLAVVLLRARRDGTRA